MKRKEFINSMGILGLAAGMGRLHDPGEEDRDFEIPPYLSPGDLIGIMAPAGYISLEDIQPAVQKLNEWGYKVRVGNTIGLRQNSFAGSDEQRLQDLQYMLDDSSLKAILCARGGYGLIRIIDKINWQRFSRNPKWIIGFSDVTTLHCHISSRLGIATIHSKMCNSFPKNWNLADEVQKATIESINNCLTGKQLSYNAPHNTANKPGQCKGLLVGGNLKTIESLLGSSSDLKTKNKILFLEDTGEYLYSLDRMFCTLLRSGKLSSLSGLIIGGFKTKKDDEGEEFGKTVEEIITEKTASFNYPVAFNFPVGHQKENFALKCGCSYKMVVDASGTTLIEA